jgi:hypothetical protein
MEAGPTLRAGVPANRYAFVDHNPTARTGLAGERRVYRYYSLPGARSLESEDDKKRAPARITDALGRVVILHHVGDPQVLVIDRVVLPYQLKRCLVVIITSLAAYRLMRLR